MQDQLRDAPIGFALCLGVIAGTTFVDAIRQLSAPESRLHHAGHVALHVTRLHRYDHSGFDVFLEREAAWHRDPEAEDEAQSFMQSDVEQSEGHLQLSTAQVDALRCHQHAALTQSAGRLAALANVSSSAQSKVERYLAHAESLARATPRGMAAIQESASQHLGLRNGRAVTALSSLSSQYVGPIGVGTRLLDGKPAEQSNIWCVFDTGSTNLWVSSDLCEDGPCAREGRQRYNHTESVTFKHPEKESMLTVHFGTGTLVGPQGVDDLHVGPFTVYNQTFAMIQEESGKVFDQVPFEGILGLAFPAMSANGVRPFFDTVIDQKGLEHNEFAVYFSKDTPSANAMFWGGVDNRFFKGPIEYFPVTDPYYWAVDLHSFKIGEECLFGVGCRSAVSLLQDNSESSWMGWMELDDSKKNKIYAIVDTGTTFFTAEDGLFEEVMQRIPPAECKNVSDETHPPLVWTLQNAVGGLRDFTFTRDMYMTRRGAGDDAQCSPAFMKINVPAKHGPAMLFGEVFLRHFYAVFDRGDGSDTAGRVGFAPALHSQELNSNIKQLTKSQPSFQETRAGGVSNPRHFASTSQVAEQQQQHHQQRSSPPFLRSGTQNL